MVAAVAAPAGPPAPYAPPAPAYYAPAPYKPTPHYKPEKLPPQPFAYTYGVKDEYSGASFDKWVVDFNALSWLALDSIIK